MITKIAFQGVNRSTPYIKSQNFKTQSPKTQDFKNQQYISTLKTKTSVNNSTISFMAKAQKTTDTKECDTSNMPSEVSTMYLSAKNMMDAMKEAAQRAKETNNNAIEEEMELKNRINNALKCYAEGQKITDGVLVRKINTGMMNPEITFMTETKNDGVTITRKSKFMGDIPLKIEEFNQDGSTNIITFTDNKVRSYEKGKRSDGNITKTDKILTFQNGKLLSYKEDVTTKNKGEALQTTVAKSLEYHGAGTSYKEGCKQDSDDKTQADLHLFTVFKEPWYFEEGIQGDSKKVARRIEFSNKEKTTYAYQENVVSHENLKIVGKGIYIEDNIPYRYCREERITRFPTASYGNIKEILYIDGKWTLSD